MVGIIDSAPTDWTNARATVAAHLPYPMLTISELARRLGFSRQYVQASVKDGCPTDSFENARLWFLSHVKHPKKLPREAVEESPAVIDSERGRSSAKNGNGKEQLDQTLENSIVACNAAYQLLQEAFAERKPSAISTYLMIHNRAVEGRVKVEKLIREEMERQKVLIPISEAQATGRRVIEIVVSRLSAMPQNLAYACNPSAPDHAFEILSRECARILADAQKAIA